jgi:nucleoside-diphosphate-sugar epimerase
MKKNLVIGGLGFIGSALVQLLEKKGEEVIITTQSSIENKKSNIISTQYITMNIISHRGFWLKDEEKNTIQAFERSFEFGFGTETDIRDYKGELVISYDMLG